MAPALEYLAPIRRESAAFASALAKVDPADQVPSCPDWTASDLLWHLTEVQFFWATIVRDRLSDPGAADAATPARPADPAAALTLFGAATAALIDALEGTPDSTAAWTWLASDQSVGFIRRHQLYEALIHRVDAELTAGGSLTPIDPVLASDGIDEMLTSELSALPPWAAFAPDGTIGALEATDTGGRWGIELGRFTGTGPESGTVYDRDWLRVVAAGAPDAAAFAARGRAADVLLWFYGRGPIERLEITGAGAAFERLAAIAKGAFD